MQNPHRLLPLACLCLGAGLAQAQTRSGPQVYGNASFQPQVFPMVAGETLGERGIRFEPQRELQRELRSKRAVRMADVAVPKAVGGFDLVDLELKRLRVISNGARYFVDGEEVGGTAELESMYTAWTGKVSGEDDSSVYLIFTTTGSRGWIRRSDGKSQLISVPRDGDWHNTYSILMHESDPDLRATAPSFECDVLEKPSLDRAGAGHQAAPPVAPGPLRAVTSYEVTIALETDFQYWQLFGDTTMATNYAISLMGAISAQYFEQTDTFITLPYLGIYSNAADPWTAPETGDVLDILFEFRDEWSPVNGNGSRPVVASLYNFLSGTNGGGGVAWRDTLCNEEFGFAASANLAGLTNFPVPTQDSLNWDFVVTAHEAGHNFYAPHTHDYCPTPLDQCSPSGFFGACQTQQVCQVGTIMGYCHLCPGGIANVMTEFHPTVANDLRTGVLNAVANGCVNSFDPASSVVRNGNGSNPAGFVELTPPVLGTNWETTVDLAGANSSRIGIGYSGTAGFTIGIGQVLVFPPVLRPLDQGLGFHSIPIANDPALLGVTFWTQAATVQPGSIQLQNAIDITLGY